WGAGMLAGLVFPFSGQGRTAPRADMDRGEVRKNGLGKTVGKQKNLPTDWVRDLVVISMPAAAAGGKKAGVYTAAENGIVPWKQAIIRWLTSRSVRGNGGVLIRQEGPEGGAGLTAVVDPNADYSFEVLIHVPGGSYFGTKQEEGMQVWVAVLDMM